MVQRVTHAEVTVDGTQTGAIGAGLCVLLGVGPEDNAATAKRLAQRIAGLRILADGEGKMNLDLATAGGEILVVSQFTLYADTSRGHRPSFIGAAVPEKGRELCQVFVEALRHLGLRVAEGVFGAHMDVHLHNDGPVTLVLTAGEGSWPADAG